MENMLANLVEAERMIATSDHIIYVTLPLMKDKKLLLKATLELKSAIAKCINSVLQYDYIFRKIRLSKDPKENLKTFNLKSAPRYNINRSEIIQILEIFDIAKRHEESTMEFVRDERVIILMGNMEKKAISLEDVKRFLSLAKTILKKVQIGMGPNIRKV